MELSVCCTLRARTSRALLEMSAAKFAVVSGPVPRGGTLPAWSKRRAQDPVNWAPWVIVSVDR